MKKYISNEEISSFCMELSMLLHAGVSAADALNLLKEESAEPMTSVLTPMVEDIDDGMSLSAAMRKSGVFPSYVCGLTETGEQTGCLVEALRSLSNYYEERARMNRYVRSSLLYPATMLLLMLIVIAVILVKVLPIFNDVYASLGAELTGVAKSLLNLGSLISAAMPVLWVILAVLAVGFFAFSAIAPFRAKVISSWRSGFGDKGVFKKINNAQLIQALSMGVVSGLPIEDSLDLAAGLMEDIPPAQERCLICRDLLDKGEALNDAMSKSGILTRNNGRLLEISRKSGSEDVAMDKLSQDLAEESEADLAEMIGRVEPSLVLVCSVLVGLILLSVMLPLTHIMSAIG